MAIATAVMAGVGAAANLYDMFIDDSRDKALDRFMDQTTELSERELGQSIKYGEIADEIRDPSSLYMQDIKKNILDVADTSADKQIRKLRSQGIYNPNLERLVKKDMTIEMGDEFMQGVSQLTNVASQYSGLEQKSFENYSNTLASAYQAEFMGAMNKPTAGEQFNSMIGTVIGAGQAGDYLGSMFS